MIHMVYCNTRDCPWYRRGQKCRHPSAPIPDVAQLNQKGAPDACPLRKEPDIICAAPRCEQHVEANVAFIYKNVQRQIGSWIYLVHVAAKAAKGNGKAERNKS